MATGQEREDAIMEETLKDLDALIRMGLVMTDRNGGLIITAAGEDAINKCNAQTWS